MVQTKHCEPGSLQHTRSGKRKKVVIADFDPQSLMVSLYWGCRIESDMTTVLFPPFVRVFWIRTRKKMSLQCNHVDSIIYHLSGASVDTNENGDILQLTDYYPYGDERIEDTLTDFHNDYTYTGKERDEDTKLLYYEARYYNSHIGRFISIDPWSGDITDPQSLNKYAYVRNNPLKYTDPSGMFNVETGEVEEDDTLSSITGEINKHWETNYTYHDIAELNNIDDPDKISVGQILIPNNKIPDITKRLVEVMRDIAADERVQNPFSFRENMKTGAEWDLKYWDEFSTKKYKDGFVFYGDNVRYDAPGNIMYGYVGSAARWATKSLLFWGANKEQNRVYSQDDDLSDVRYIEYGMELYKGIGSQERSGSTSFENRSDWWSLFFD